MFPPKKTLYTPRKLTFCTRKYPPQTEKNDTHPTPNSHFLGASKNLKPLALFGIRTPHRFLPKQVFGKKPKAHEGIAGRLPCQIPIHRLQVGGLQGRRLGGSTWCPGSVGVFVCRFIFMEPKRKKTKTEVV